MIFLLLSPLKLSPNFQSFFTPCFLSLTHVTFGFSFPNFFLVGLFICFTSLLTQFSFSVFFFLFLPSSNFYFYFTFFWSCKKLEHIYCIQFNEFGVSIHPWKQHHHEGHRYIHQLPKFPPNPFIIINFFLWK